MSHDWLRLKLAFHCKPHHRLRGSLIPSGTYLTSFTAQTISLPLSPPPSVTDVTSEAALGERLFDDEEDSRRQSNAILQPGARVT